MTNTENLCAIEYGLTFERWIPGQTEGSGGWTPAVTVSYAALEHRTRALLRMVEEPERYRNVIAVERLVSPWSPS